MIDSPAAPRRHGVRRSAIHVFPLIHAVKTWMAGPSPATTMRADRAGGRSFIVAAGITYVSPGGRVCPSQEPADACVARSATKLSETPSSPCAAIVATASGKAARRMFPRPACPARGSASSRAGPGDTPRLLWRLARHSTCRLRPARIWLVFESAPWTIRAGPGLRPTSSCGARSYNVNQATISRLAPDGSCG
jgi:hypothetical protein